MEQGETGTCVLSKQEFRKGKRKCECPKYLLAGTTQLCLSADYLFQGRGSVCQLALANKMFYSTGFGTMIAPEQWHPLSFLKQEPSYSTLLKVNVQAPVQSSLQDPLPAIFPPSSSFISSAERTSAEGIWEMEIFFIKESF